MIPYIISIISLILDGVLTNFLPFLEGNLSLFTPLCTVISLFFYYPFFRKEKKKFYISVFLLGIIYDLCFTNLLFWNAILFLILALISQALYKNYGMGPLKIILYSAILVIVYESLNALIILVFGLVPISFPKLLYKITHTYLLNVIYMEIIYIILKLLPKKYKKISIN